MSNWKTTLFYRGNHQSVLYIDHQGHPAPITECFHATASRRLSSTIDRVHRPSTITQVDSAYCPQCLMYFDIITATIELGGYCNKEICRRSPTTFEICKVEQSDSKKKYYYYASGEWNSKESLFATSVEELDKKQKQSLLLSKTQQEQQLQEPIGQHYTTVVELWEQELQQKNNNNTTKRGSSTNKKIGGGASTKSNKKNDPADSWSLEALEESLQKKKEFQSNYIHNQHNTIGGENSNSGIKLKRINLGEDENNEPSGNYCNHSCLEDKSVLSLLMSALTTNTPLATPTHLDKDNEAHSQTPQNQSSQQYYYSKPLPVALRVRKSRRCRAELAEGRPGILIKPKLNPLEGDSSLRTGHGQWWKKDSSAIHVLPRMKCVRSYKAGDDSAGRVFLLNVTNPTLGIVKLRLCPTSTYVGEPTWDTTDKSETTSKFENLLIDSLSNQKVNVELLLSPSSSAATTTTESFSPTVELDSAEDAFVDFGKSKKMPQEVLDWIAKMENADNQVEVGEEPKITLLAPTSSSSSSSTGIAWFELIVPNVAAAASTEDSSWWKAFALSMQIQVGNGSWEASLIKPKTTISEEEKEETVDWVSFDLMITWPPPPAEEEKEEP